MDNEFQQQADREQKRVQAEQLGLILELVKAQGEKLDALKKEVRTVRAELRNLDKLRPLRTKEEEEGEEPEEAVQPDARTQE